MKSDLSRDTFERQHRFARVLMQQGRVVIDGDWNEQVSILLDEIRMLAADLIGDHGGPGDGFRITTSPELSRDFLIGRGHYYVNGILCDWPHERACYPVEEVPPRYMDQPHYPMLEEDEAELQNNASYLVYLDVWERHLNHLQAEHIRELALGGPDTASRSQIVSQVKVAEIPVDAPTDATCDDLMDLLVHNPQMQIRCLRARARVPAPIDDPCIIPPEARYRGAENQLYRVEIHDPGTAGGNNPATFKWSRDNGSVVFGIKSLQGSTLELTSFGRDAYRGVKEGQWVEIVDDCSELRALPQPLRRVVSVDRVDLELTLDVPSGEDMPVFDAASTTHPILRRWDQLSDAIPVREGRWIDLEDGVQIRFENGGTYRTGDFWLIPARTATRDVIWPQEIDADGERQPRALPPNGIERHYAPLQRISVDGNGTVLLNGDDCRCSFNRLCDRVSFNERPAETEITMPLATVVYDEDEGFGERAPALVNANAEIIDIAVANAATVRVEVRAVSSTRRGVAIAERRVQALVDAYVERGIAVDLIRSSVRILPSATDDTSIETALTRSVSSTESVRLDLDSVEDIGTARRNTLVANGIRDTLDLALESTASVAETLNVGTDLAETLLNNTRLLIARQ